MLQNCVAVLSLIAALGLLSASGSRATQPPGKAAKPARVDRDGQALPAGAVARLGSTRFRHQELLVFLGFAGSERHVLAASADGDVRLWDVATGKVLWRMTTAPHDGSNIALSGDGKTFALRLDDGWSVRATASGKELRRFARRQLEKESQIPDLAQASVRLSADGQLLIVGDDSWRSMEGGDRFAVWKTATGTLVRAWELPAKAWLRVFSLADDGATLATLETAEDGNRQTLRLWDVAGGKQRSAARPPMDYLRQLRFLPDGKTLLGVSAGWARAFVFDGATGKQLAKFDWTDLERALLTADGKSLVGVGADRLLQWELATGKELRQFPLPRPIDKVRLGASLWGFASGGSLPRVAALSPDGKTAAISAGANFRLWEMGSGKEVGGRPGHDDAVEAVAFAPDGKLVVSAAPGGPALLWEATTGRVVHTLPFAPSPEIQLPRLVPAGGMPMGMPMMGMGGWHSVSPHGVRIAFAPDGQTVAGLASGILQRWDATTGKPLQWPVTPARLLSFAFAPDGKVLALNGDDGVTRLVQPASGKQVRAHRWASVKRDENGRAGLVAFAATFSRDGKVLHGACTVTEWNEVNTTVAGVEVASGLERVRLPVKPVRPSDALRGIGYYDGMVEAVVLEVAVAPDGKHLVTAGPTTIKLWDLVRRRPECVLECQDVVTETVMFSPDGKWLLAGKYDGAIRVWDVATARVLGDVPAHEAAVTALAFSPDGKRLASGSADSTVLLWDWAEFRAEVTVAPVATASAPEALWKTLAGPHAARAFDAQAAMEATPAATVAFLKARLKPVTPVDPQLVEKLLADLDSKLFAVRRAAVTELEQLGDLAGAALRKRLAARPSLETRQRLEALIARLDDSRSGLLLQGLRAVEVLEHIGTPAARQVLEALATSAPGHRLTEEAAASVRRLQRATP
jgi:WD40 repeat protein